MPVFAMNNLHGDERTESIDKAIYGKNKNSYIEDKYCNIGVMNYYIKYLNEKILYAGRH